MVFQISTNRLSGQSADTVPRAARESKLVVVEPPPCAASSVLGVHGDVVLVVDCECARGQVPWILHSERRPESLFIDPTKRRSRNGSRHGILIAFERWSGMPNVRKLRALLPFPVGGVLLAVYVLGVRPEAEGLYGSNDGVLLHRAHSQIWNGQDVEAGKLFLNAVRRDSASPYRWCDLGDYYSGQKKTAEARYCFARAVNLGRGAPPIRLRAANYHLQAGDIGQALSLMWAVLGQTAFYDDLIFGYYKRLEIPADQVLRTGVAAEGRGVQAYFRSLLTTGDRHNADIVWKWQVTHGLVHDEARNLYVNFLMAQREPEAAFAAWTEGRGTNQAGYGVGNLVWNGGFERELSGSILDWIIEPGRVAAVARAKGGAHSGDWSLRLDPDSKGGAAISQLLVVRPGKYILRAQVRGEGLDAEQGLRLRVYDFENPARFDTWTHSVAASKDWTALTHSFTVPAPTRMLRIQIAAQPSFTAWIDDIELEPGRGA